MLKGKRVGSVVSVMYPTHGSLNILRRVSGKIIRKGTGPNGPNVTIEEHIGNKVRYRTLSRKKCVEM